MRLPTPSATVIPTNRSARFTSDGPRDSPEPRGPFRVPLLSWPASVISERLVALPDRLAEPHLARAGDEIEAQLFSFKDKGDREVSLRPEMTPTVCRMVGEKAGALKRPIKWFSIAEFYRYERAQKGRLRAFHHRVLGQGGT